MKNASIFIVTCLCFSSALSYLYVPRDAKTKNEESDNFEDIGDPLILTNLIKEGKIEEARNESEVKLPNFKDVRSYSGYFTVDEDYNSNLFFWFIPALKVDYKKAPVVLWLQGGPGSSSLYGLFYENGPFKVVDDGSIHLRDNCWADNHSMIYIDSPVGTGFSFTTRGGYAQNQTAVSSGLFKALLQFFTLFPELEGNEFYITGESYGGKYVPSLAHLIHIHKNLVKPSINLKGLAIGNGLSDPKHQLKYSDYLYQIGLIDFNVQREMLKLELTTRRQIRNKQWANATRTWTNIIGLFCDASGFSNYYNFLQSDLATNQQGKLLKNYLQHKDIQSSLHVGNVTFRAQSGIVYMNLAADIMKSVAPFISALLENYRVLFYNGQLDIIVAYPLTENFLQNLKFNGDHEYKTALRHKWYVGKELAGYAKSAGNLTEVLVRNAGHMVPMDQPVWALDLITKFIANEPLYKN